MSRLRTLPASIWKASSCGALFLQSCHVLSFDFASGNGRVTTFRNGEPGEHAAVLRYESRVARPTSARTPSLFSTCLTDRSGRAHDTLVNHGRAHVDATEQLALRAKAGIRRNTRVWLPWYNAFRILGVVLLLQVSGMAHAVVDTWDALANHSQPCSDGCENDNSGRECPPGCPKCHCSHVSPAVLQARSGEIVALLTSDGAATLVPHEASAPSTGQPLFVFRPPKFALLLA